MKSIEAEQRVIIFNLKEICDRCMVTREFIIQLVDYGVVDPKGDEPDKWQFTSISYLKIRKATRLKHDLSINEAGIALALELIDEREKMKQEIEHLRQRVHREGQ